METYFLLHEFFELPEPHESESLLYKAFISLLSNINIQLPPFNFQLSPLTDPLICFFQFIKMLFCFYSEF